MLTTRKRYRSGQPRSFFASNGFLALFACLLVAVSLTLFYRQRIQDRLQLEQSMAARLRAFASETETRYNGIYNALDRLVSRGAPRAETANAKQLAQWDQDAAFYIETLDGIGRIAWVDETLMVRRVKPLEANAVHLHQPADQMLSDPLATNVWRASTNGFAFSGYIIGTLDYASLMAPAAREAGNDYGLRLVKGDTPVFATENWAGATKRYTVRRRIILKDTGMLDLYLAPTARRITAAMITSRNTLLFALLFSALAIGAVFMAQNYSISAIASEARHQAVVEAIPDLIMRFDREGTYTFVKPARDWEPVAPADELLGQNAQDMIPAEAAQQAARMRNEVWATGEDRTHEYALERDGETRYYETRYSAYDDREILAICRDITDRVMAQQEQERLQQQLVQAQKMESVGRLAGGVAHDFNNMLSVILGTIDLALAQVDASDPLYGDLLEVRKAGQRSADLTRQLLAFARKQSIAPVTLNLNRAVSGMLRMLRRLIGEDIELVWRPADDLWPVQMDPSQIDQILANLCVNARDAIDNVGQLIIETANVTVDGAHAAKNPDATAGDHVRLTVADTGRGISPAVMAHLFEPFFTTKGVGEGTGLGLATVYGIVRQNNGFIDVESEPGRGATFLLYFPRGATPVQDAPVADHTDQEMGADGEVVLVVEDEPSVLRLTERVLQQRGYQVLSTTDAQEALRIASDQAERIHLVISDVVMPQMNVHHLVQQLRAMQPTMRFLFMSGYTPDIVAERGLDEGVHFLSKPFKPSDLAAAVREALA